MCVLVSAAAAVGSVVRVHRQGQAHSPPSSPEPEGKSQGKGKGRGKGKGKGRGKGKGKEKAGKLSCCFQCFK